MSQRAVEQILGRLLTDPEFRDDFFGQSVARLLARHSLSETEREALVGSRSTIFHDLLEELGNQLEPDICRADLRAPERQGAIQ